MKIVFIHESEAEKPARQNHFRAFIANRLWIEDKVGLLSEVGQHADAVVEKSPAASG